MRVFRPQPARLVVVLCGAALLAACEHIIVPRVERVELHRSAAQHLVLENGDDRPVSIEPTTEDATPLQIAPGSDLTFDFVVATVAQVAPVPEQPWRAVIEGTETNDAIMIEPEGYMRQSGPDLVLLVGLADEPPTERRFSLQCGLAGWAAEPAAEAVHTFDLSRPPPAGVPERICPP